MEAKRGRRVQPERPLTRPKVPVAVRRMRWRKLARSTAAGVLASAFATGCSGSSNPAPKLSPPSTTASATATTSTATVSGSVEPYSWQRDQGQPITLGGGSTSSLSAVVAPDPGGVWLIAGTQLTATGGAEATVWTSPTRPPGPGRYCRRRPATGPTGLRLLTPRLTGGTGEW